MGTATGFGLGAARDDPSWTHQPANRTNADKADWIEVVKDIGLATLLGVVMFGVSIALIVSAVRF